MSPEIHRDNRESAQAMRESSDSHKEVLESSEEYSKEKIANAENLQNEARADFAKLFDRFMEVKGVSGAETSDTDKEESAQVAEKALEAQILILEHEEMLREAQAQSTHGNSANELLTRLDSLEPILTTGIKSQIEARATQAGTEEEKARLDGLLARWNVARSGSSKERSEIMQSVRKMRSGEVDPYEKSSKLAHDMESLAIKKNVLAERGSPLPDGDRKEFDRLHGILGSRIEKEGRSETLRGYEALLEKHFERPVNVQ